MLKRFCDRCGNEIEVADPMTVFIGRVSAARSGTIKEQKELCDDCLKDHVRFMDGWPVTPPINCNVTNKEDG